MSANAAPTVVSFLLKMFLTENSKQNYESFKAQMDATAPTYLPLLSCTMLIFVFSTSLRLSCFVRLGCCQRLPRGSPDDVPRFISLLRWSIGRTFDPTNLSSWQRSRHDRCIRGYRCNCWSPVTVYACPHPDVRSCSWY